MNRGHGEDGQAKFKFGTSWDSFYVVNSGVGILKYGMEWQVLFVPCRYSSLSGM